VGLLGVVAGILAFTKWGIWEASPEVANKCLDEPEIQEAETKRVRTEYHKREGEKP